MVWEKPGPTKAAAEGVLFLPLWRVLQVGGGKEQLKVGWDQGGLIARHHAAAWSSQVISWLPGMQAIGTAN